MESLHKTNKTSISIISQENYVYLDKNASCYKTNKQNYRIDYNAS